MKLPPLYFTPQVAAAVAVALSRSEHVLWVRDPRSALNKIVAAMPERGMREARSTAETVRLLVQRVPGGRALDDDGLPMRPVGPAGSSPAMTSTPAARREVPAGAGGELR